MTEIKISKKEERYINSLLSKNRQEVVDALGEIKEEGTIVLLPFLIDLLNSTKDEEIRKQVYELLCELKLTACIPVLVDSIKNEKYSGVREMLVRSCWENGLDYTPYLRTFVELVITEPFMTSFEAFTVIENMEGSIAPQVVEEMIQLLEQALPEAAIEKKSLLFDLIKIIPAIK